jgi:hypothetical protein
MVDPSLEAPLVIRKFVQAWTREPGTLTQLNAHKIVVIEIRYIKFALRVKYVS